MGIIESGLTVIAGVLMVIALLASLLPFLPGPFMLWVISLIYGVLTGFHHLTVPAAVMHHGADGRRHHQRFLDADSRHQDATISRAARRSACSSAG